MYFYSGVSNYRETPYIISDDYSNIGNYAATIKGSVYIARDGASLSVASIYQANGTSWVAIGSSVTAAASSLQAVTTVGNTSNQGIVVTANGISTNSLTNTGLTAKSIPFVATGGLISQDNTNFVWDNTNKWLGIQTNTPTAELDLHSSTTTPMIALNNTAGNASNILFQNSNVSKFRLGNNAANNFVLFNNTLTSTAFFVAGANNNFLLGSTTDDTVSKLQVTGNSAFTANVTAGSSFNFTTNQTNTNVTDTGDGSVVINNALTGTGATNEEVLRALTVGNSNSRTGGSVLVNSRAISTISSSLASTTTTNLDQIYLDYDTAAGTVTNGRGVTIKRMYGTSQAAFVTSTLTSTNRSHLFIGGYTLPSGAWGIYSSVTDSSSFLGRMIVGTNTDDTVNKLQVTGNTKISGALAVNATTTGSTSYTASLIDTNSNIGTNLYLGFSSFNLLLSVVNNGSKLSANGFNYLGFKYSNGNTIVGGDPSSTMPDKFNVLVNSATTDGQGMTFVDLGTSGNVGAALNWVANSGSNTLASIRTKIQSGFNNTILTFSTNNNSNVLTERYRITETGNISINSTTDIASAQLFVTSTTKGFLPPRMTTTQKNAIATPATGLTLYDSTLNKLCVYTGAAWETVTSL